MQTLRHPLLRLSRLKRNLSFCACLLLTLVLGYALQRLDVPLQTPAAHWGMLSFEMAGSTERSQQIIDSWNVAARDNAQSGLLLDFLFPIAYSTTLTLGCLWAASVFRDRGYRKMGWLSAVVAWLQWPAAAFDYVENIALWIQLRGTVHDPWPRIACVAASIKFLLIAVGLCVWISALTIWILRRRAPLPRVAQPIP